MKHSNRYSPELRERAVLLVLDHQGAHEFAMGRHRLGVVEDRLLGRDAAQLQSS